MYLLTLLASNAWGPFASRTPASNGIPRVGVSTPCGAVSSREIIAFVPDLVGVVDVWKAFCSGDATAYSRGAVGFTNSQSESAGGVGISISCGAVSNRGTTVFVPGWLELQMYDRISDPGMGLYPPGWHWLHETQLISNQPVATGFPQGAGRYRPGRPPFSPPACLEL